MEITCKLCSSPTTVTYTVSDKMDMSWFYRSTVKQLCTDMNLTSCYIIQGRGSACVDEDPPMLIGEDETVATYFNTHDKTLYVQPK